MHNDALTTYTAAGAITLPWWLPYLHQVSVVAAELAPILGVAWLLIRLALSIREYFEKRNTGSRNDDCKRT